MPQSLQTSKRTTAAGDNVVIAGEPERSIYLQLVTLVNAGNHDLNIVIPGGQSTVIWRGMLPKNGGIAYLNYGPHGQLLPKGTPFIVQLDATGSLDVNVTQYYFRP